MSPKIYIAAQPGEVRGRIESLLQQDYLLEMFDNAAAFREATGQATPEVVILQGQFARVLDSVESLASKSMVLVFAESMDVDERLSLYRQQVKQVITGTDQIAERICQGVRMLCYRTRELLQRRQQSLTQGTVQAFSIPDILQNALLEKKNLIIKVRLPELDAKLRTFQGHLVNAFTSNLSNEDAALKLLHLSSGAITIRSYQKLNEYAPICASVAAIIAESRFQEQEILEGLEKYCFGLSNPEFTRAATAEGQAGKVEQSLLALVETETPFRQLLMASPYPVLDTARAIFGLCRSGQLRVKGEGASVEAFQNDDIRHIRENLLPEGMHEGTLLVLGLPDTGRSELVRTIAGFQQAHIKSMQSLEFTRLRLAQDLTLSLCGVSIEESFLPILEKLSDGIVAGIFLINYSEPGQFEFCRYLFQQIRNHYSFPVAFGLTNMPEGRDDAVTDFRNRFGVPDDTAAIGLNPSSFSDFRNILRTLERVTVVSEEDAGDA